MNLETLINEVKVIKLEHKIFFEYLQIREYILLKEFDYKLFNNIYKNINKITQTPNNYNQLKKF